MAVAHHPGGGHGTTTEKKEARPAGQRDRASQPEMRIQMSHLMRVPMALRLERRRRVTEQGCWEWTGRQNNAGYGGITITSADGTRASMVHRVSYELFVGPIPEGLQLDHLCRNRLCFNPEHLEPVTPRENLLRSPLAPAGINARKTHCPRDHEYTVENTWVSASAGRQCKTCARDRRSARRAVSA